MGSEMLQTIMAIIDGHTETINNSKKILDDLELQIQQNKDKLRCCFDLKDGAELKTVEESLTDRERLNRALVKEIMLVLTADEPVIRSDSCVSGLVKLLVEAWLCSHDAGEVATEASVVALIEQRATSVDAFIKSGCQQRVVHCLKTAVADGQRELTRGSSIRVVLPYSQKYQTTGRDSTMGPVPAAILSTCDTISDELMNESEDGMHETMHVLNNEVKSQLTELLDDQLDGMAQVSAKLQVGSDMQRQSMNRLLTDVRKKLAVEDALVLESMHTVSTAKMAGSNRQRSVVVQRMLDRFRNNSVFGIQQNSLATNSAGELIGALDDALDELDNAVRNRIFEQARSSQPRNRTSSYYNLSPSNII